jgi:hypothetical protein
MMDNRLDGSNWKSMIFAKDSNPYNLSYKEWTETWWRWVLSIPKEINPLLDNNGEHCAEGQCGPVWFLAGTTGNTYHAERMCNILGEKAVLFPIIVSEFSFSEVPHIKRNDELFSYVSKDMDQCSVLEASIDGSKLHDLHKFRVQIGPFDVSFPPNNLWDVRPGPTKAVSDGFWVFLRPLNEGDHTIEFRGVEPHFRTQVRYQLTVKTRL